MDDERKAASEEESEENGDADDKEKREIKKGDAVDETRNIGKGRDLLSEFASSVPYLIRQAATFAQFPHMCRKSRIESY
jgi:hypothetical protein